MINRFKMEAYQILVNPDVEAKIAAGLRIGEILSGGLFQSNNNTISKDIPKLPARSDDYEFQGNSDNGVYEIVNDFTIKDLLESTLINVEISAMEVSSVLILMAENMPEDFYLDFASHLSDEARHAQEIQQALLPFGGMSKRLKYNLRLWNKVLIGELLVEKIMIENVIEEGWAADKTVDLIKSLNDRDYPEVADMFQKINSDEIRHARLGNKWVMKLLNENEQHYLEMYDRLVQIVHPAAARIHYLPIRIASGFKSGFIKRYLAK